MGIIESEAEAIAWAHQKAALVKACREAGVPEPQVGQAFRVVHVSGVGGAQSPRMFEYTLGPVPVASGVAGVINTPAAQPVAAQPVAPQPVAAAPAGMNPADTARTLLAQGLSVPDVAQATGLPPSTVAALAAAPQF